MSVSGVQKMPTSGTKQATTEMMPITRAAVPRPFSAFEWACVIVAMRSISNVIRP